MHLVVVLLRALIVAEQQAGHGHQIGKDQLLHIPGEADDKRHDQEVREEEQVFPCLKAFHIVHDREIEVEVEYGQHPGQQVFFAKVEMVGYDKDVGGGQVNECADVQSEKEVRDHAHKMRDKDQQNELIEPDRLLFLGRGMFVL